MSDFKSRDPLIVSGRAVPDFTVVADAAARLLLTVEEGDEAKQVDDGSHWIYDGTTWHQYPGSGGAALHDLAGASHSVDTLANLNSKVSDATLIDTADSRLSDARTPTAHDLAGAEHNADTLADLNSKVSDATLDGSGDSRPPDTHSIGGAAHSADSLANLNSKVSDAALDDSTAARTPTTHDLAGSEHGVDTLTDLNSKVSDATLIDTADSRLSDSRFPTGTASGQLGGSYPGPDVRGIRKTGGPTNLTVGAIADGQNVVRSGTSIVGQTGSTPAAHALGGAQHNTDTLANLNAKVSDATLIDTADSRLSDARTPTAHASTHANGGGDGVSHDTLDDYLISQHRVINDSGSSTTELWSASKVDAELAAVIAGVDTKPGVDTTTTGLGSITLSGEQTLNGVLTSSSRVLVTEQGTPADNGIYDTGGGPWTRSLDADDDSEVTNGNITHVINSGSTKFQYKYLLVTADPITVGSTGQTWEEHRDIIFGVTSGTATEGDDGRVPSQDENDALQGTNGTPSTGNRYVTNSDTRNSDARTPTSHTASHQHGGGDEVATVTPAANMIPKADGTGKLPAGFIPSVPASVTTSKAVSTVLTSTTSLSYIPVAGMSITPGAGDYVAMFSCEGQHTSKNDVGDFAIFSNGVLVGDSERALVVAFNNSQENVHTHVYIQGLGAGQTIDVRFKTTAGTVSVINRSLITMKVG